MEKSREELMEMRKQTFAQMEQKLVSVRTLGLAEFG